MPQVQTARGPIDCAELGATLMHEHIFVLSPEIAQNYPKAWGDEDTRVAAAVARLDELAACGIQSVVDLTVVGLGRSIPRIRRVASGTRINILVATGIYTYNDLPFFFRFRGNETMVDLFVRDIEEGIAGTGIRAAALKCATDKQGVTRDVERVLRAVASTALFGDLWRITTSSDGRM